jgi:Spy/CpxP family protein refolding chaperone
MVKTWQIILATIAIFLAGLVTGGALAFGAVRWVTHHRMMMAAANGQLGVRNGQVQQLNPQLMRNFALQLDLTKEQRAKIGPIMRRTAKLMQDEISDILTPDQKIKFEELIRLQKARLQQYRQSQMAQQAPAELAPVAPSPSPEPTK